MWTEKSYKAPPLENNYRQLRNAESRKSNLPPLTGYPIPNG